MEHIFTSQEHETGWVKPTRSRTLAELLQLIADKRAELALLEAEAASLQHHAKLEAIAKVRNIMRAHQLSLEDIGEESASGSRKRKMS
ncbi:MAG: H-NS histone family protein [Burkholderiales bacterium]|jgi:hypothetical protein|nr:H-NS histone family protein [Burkholderiales bacterium]